MTEPNAQAMRDQALEDAATIAEQDCDWTAFARKQKIDWKGFEENPVFGLPEGESVTAYRHGILVGKMVAVAIRALKGKPLMR